MSSWSSLGGLSTDDPRAFLVIVGLIVLALVVIPILLFGIDLIVVGCFLAVSLVGRVCLGRPWVIEARATGALNPERVLEWRVSGWRRSSQLVEEVVSDLSAGREPNPSSADQGRLPV
jgi:hypothetical protein